MMVVDGILGFIVIWRLWRWKLVAGVLMMLPFIVVDATFLIATLLKLADGAWLPVLFGMRTDAAHHHVAPRQQYPGSEDAPR